MTLPLVSDERIVVFGATSAMAQVAIRLWAKQGARLFLVARDGAKLKAVVKDATVRGGDVKSLVLKDFNDTTALRMVTDAAWTAWDGLDGVLIAHGHLPEQEAVQDDVRALLECLRTNGESVCQILALLAPRFEAQAQKGIKGWMAAISSVAANRGRAKIYAYGTGKAMVSHFLSGLRQRLAPVGVRIIDVRPGPVETPMTAGMHMPLMAKVDPVGEAIVKACAKANGTVYVPRIWQLIMFILDHVPEKIWLKMKI